VVNNEDVSATLASLTRVSGESVNTYNITGATFNALTGANASNYILSNNSYNPFTLTITPAPLKALVQMPQVKVYGTVDPLLSKVKFTTSGKINTTVTNWNGTNTVINDTTSSKITAGSVFTSLTRATGEDVGTYAI